MLRQRTGVVCAKRGAKHRAGCGSGVGRCATGVALAGLLLAGAFAMAVGMGPGDHSWLGWGSLLPLFITIRWLSPWRALLCGALWGGALCGFSVYAVPAGIEPAILSLLLLMVVPGLYACFGAWFTRWYRFDPLVLGVGWIGVELALLPLGLKGFPRLRVRSLPSGLGQRLVADPSGRRAMGVARAEVIR